MGWNRARASASAALESDPPAVENGRVLDQPAHGCGLEPGVLSPDPRFELIEPQDRSNGSTRVAGRFVSIYPSGG